MKLFTLICAIIVTLSANSSFAQQDEDINFFCKTDCLDRGGTIGKCNALCSTKSDTGARTKDSTCLSSCMGRTDGTAYYCYSLCDTAGQTIGGGVREQSPNNSDAGAKKN